jgi:hypothetical protein
MRLCRWQQWRHCHCIKQPDLPGRADRLRQSHRVMAAAPQLFSQVIGLLAPPRSSAATVGGTQLHQYCLLVAGQRRQTSCHSVAWSNSANLTGCSIMSNTRSTCTGTTSRPPTAMPTGRTMAAASPRTAKCRPSATAISVSAPGSHRTASRPTPAPLTIMNRRRKTGRTCRRSTVWGIRCHDNGDAGVHADYLRPSAGAGERDVADCIAGLGPSDPKRRARDRRLRAQNGHGLGADNHFLRPRPRRQGPDRRHRRHRRNRWLRRGGAPMPTDTVLSATRSNLAADERGALVALDRDALRECF